MERLTAQWGARARRWRWNGVVVGILLVALGAGARPAAAQTLIGHMTGDDRTGTLLNSNRIKAVSFTTTGRYALSAVRLRLLKRFETGDGIVEIRNDAGGLNPGDTTLVSFVNPSLTTLVYDTYTFTPTAPFEFQENTKYWLTVRGTHRSSAWDWLRSISATPPTGSGATFGAYREALLGGADGDDDEFVWSSSPEFNQFEIEGTPVQSSDTPAVPEPSAALLFLPALGVVALARRKR